MREALAQDLADIESIASSVIDFATFEVTEEKSERIDFWSLVEFDRRRLSGRLVRQ